MKKYILLIIFIFIASISIAGAPSRQVVYTSGETIYAQDVTDNEDVIFDYLTAGVEVYADGTIVNDDVSATANLQASKINLTSIAQNVANTGTFTNTGNATITGTLTVTGDVITTDSIDDTDVDWGVGSGQIDLTDVLNGTELTVTTNLNSTGIIVSTQIQNTNWHSGGYSNGEASVCVDEGGRLFVRDGGCN